MLAGVVAIGCTSEGPEQGEAPERLATLAATAGPSFDVRLTSGFVRSWQCGSLTFDGDGDARGLAGGEAITDAYASWEVQVRAFEADGATPAEAAVFDSANPSAGASDLGTPNERFGGPGVGVGGASNDTALGGLLIKTANAADANGDGRIDEPQPDPNGGLIELTFGREFCVMSASVLDVDPGEPPVRFTLLNEQGSVLIEQLAFGLGDNSHERLGIGICHARTLQIAFAGDAAVDEILLCTEPPQSLDVRVQENLDEVSDIAFDVEVQGLHEKEGWVSIAGRRFAQYPFLIPVEGPLPDAPLTAASAPAGRYEALRVGLRNVEAVRFDGSRASHPDSDFTSFPKAFSVSSCGNVEIGIDFGLNVRMALDLQEIALGIDAIGAGVYVDNSPDC